MTPQEKLEAETIKKLIASTLLLLSGWATTRASVAKSLRTFNTKIQVLKRVLELTESKKDEEIGQFNPIFGQKNTKIAQRLGTQTPFL